jgi:ABC-type nitrate/sulfonate/bicarbonate transport system substrate-binding protein
MVGRTLRMNIAIVAAALLAATIAGARAEPVKIRLSFIVPVSNWATMLFKTPGLARHLNKSYTFEAVHYKNTTSLPIALASGELEIANFGFSSLPIAILNAGMTDLRIIADELHDGVPGYYSNQYLVLKDSPIKTVEDLKGKVLAAAGYGTGTDIPLRAMLAKHNMQDKRDVTIIEAQIPTMPAMLKERKVDLIALPLPFTANPDVRATTRTIFTQGDAMGVTQLAMWVARQSFIDKNRAALVDFMEDVLRQERWYLDPANHDAAVNIAADLTKSPADRWNSWLFKKDGQNGDYYHNPDGKLDLDALQTAIETQVKLGFLKQTIDVRKFTDLSLVEEAVKRLK